MNQDIDERWCKFEHTRKRSSASKGGEDEEGEVFDGHQGAVGLNHGRFGLKANHTCILSTDSLKDSA